MHPTVDRVIWVNTSWQHIELFPPPSHLYVPPTSSADFVKSWKAGISREGPAPDISSTVYAYWILHHTCFDIQIHHEAARVVESNTEINKLLLRAKKAREAEDMAALRAVSQGIQEIWRSYVLKQKMFERRVEKRAEFVDGLLGWNDMELAPIATSASIQGYEGKGKGRAKDVGAYYGGVDASPSSIIKVEDGYMHLCG